MGKNFLGSRHKRCTGVGYSRVHVARDAFGNALGSSIADGIGRGSQQYTELEAAQDTAREMNRFGVGASAQTGNAIGLVPCSAFVTSNFSRAASIFCGDGAAIEAA